MTHPALHEGELEMQSRLGVMEAGGRVAASIRPSIPAVAARFLAQRPFAVASMADAEGRPWAALWSDAPGFLQVLDERTVRIPGRALDVLTRQQAALPGHLGLLAIDPETRRRMRLNGRARWVDDDLELVAEEVYSNCPKFIQRRHLERQESVSESPRRGLDLEPRHRRWVEEADTFFIATLHQQVGADASHRGGVPGFVRWHDDHHLEFADYSGNNLFNSLGNLVVHPKVGLLFIDFDAGHALHLTGRAQLLEGVDLEESSLATGTLVRVEVEEWLEQPRAMPWRGPLLELSPFLRGNED